jgi:hypothetical protein
VGGPVHWPVNGASWAVCRDYGFVKRVDQYGGYNAINPRRMGDIVMREKGSVTAFCAVTAAIGATVFASAGAQAVPLAGYSGLNTAIHSATSAQQVRYICRGSHRQRCYHVAGPERSPGYYPQAGYYPYNKGVWGNMYPGQDEYNVHYWASGANKF